MSTRKSERVSGQIPVPLPSSTYVSEGFISALMPCLFGAVGTRGACRAAWWGCELWA